MSPNRQRTAIALAILAGFGFATFEASLAHTDDGCFVELHCFACRWALSSIAQVTSPVEPPARLMVIGRTAPEPTPFLGETSAPAHASRGPPFVSSSTRSL